jgi:hypothetical protein
LIPFAEPVVAAELLFISDFLLTVMGKPPQDVWEILGTLCILQAACQTKSTTALFLNLLIRLRSLARAQNRPARIFDGPGEKLPHDGLIIHPCAL